MGKFFLEAVIPGCHRPLSSPVISCLLIPCLFPLAPLSSVQLPKQWMTSLLGPPLIPRMSTTSWLGSPSRLLATNLKVPMWSSFLAVMGKSLWTTTPSAPQPVAMLAMGFWETSSTTKQSLLLFPLVFFILARNCFFFGSPALQRLSFFLKRCCPVMACRHCKVANFC